jgi:hypothetical protein
MKAVLIAVVILMVAVTGIYAEKVATLTDVFKPSYLVVDDSQFYVVEKSTVFIYSLKDYKLKGKFGKAGEGPQEFKAAPGGSGGISIFPQKDYLHINSIGKISTWTKDGKFINEARGNVMISMVQPLGKKLVGLGAAFDAKTRQVDMAANLYDDKLNKTKELSRQEMMKAGSYKFPITNPAIFSLGDKVVIPGEKNRFSIKVFDAEGNETVHITRDYKRLPVTKKYKDEIDTFFRTSPFTKDNYEQMKKMISFNDEFPAIQGFNAADNTIYIQTYKEQDGKSEFFVYKSDGTFIKQVFLTIHRSNVMIPNPAAFKNNTFYQIIENEDTEEWELHAVKVL